MKRYIRSTEWIEPNGVGSGIWYLRETDDVNYIREVYEDSMENYQNSKLRCIAANPNTPVDILQALFDFARKNPLSEIGDSLSNNPKLSSELLDRLADIGSNYARYWIAEKNPNTSYDTLSKLSRDRDRQVAQAAYNRLLKY